MNAKHYNLFVTSEEQTLSVRMILKCTRCGDDRDWNKLVKGSVYERCEESKGTSNFLKFKIFMQFL